MNFAMRIFQETVQPLPSSDAIWKMCVKLCDCFEHLISWNSLYGEESRIDFLPPIFVACALSSYFEHTHTMSEHHVYNSIQSANEKLSSITLSFGLQILYHNCTVWPIPLFRRDGPSILMYSELNGIDLRTSSWIKMNIKTKLDKIDWKSYRLSVSSVFSILGIRVLLWNSLIKCTHTSELQSESIQPTSQLSKL